MSPERLAEILKSHFGGYESGRERLEKLRTMLCLTQLTGPASPNVEEDEWVSKLELLLRR